MPEQFAVGDIVVIKNSRRRWLNLYEIVYIYPVDQTAFSICCYEILEDGALGDRRFKYSPKYLRKVG